MVIYRFLSDHKGETLWWNYSRKVRTMPAGLIVQKRSQSFPSFLILIISSGVQLFIHEQTFTLRCLIKFVLAKQCDLHFAGSLHIELASVT